MLPRKVQRRPKDLPVRDGNARRLRTPQQQNGDTRPSSMSPQQNFHAPTEQTRYTSLVVLSNSTARDVPTALSKIGISGGDEPGRC
jgi:hypothetical protein